MNKTTFISGANAAYYPMLREWIHSVQKFPESQKIDINILDAGLTSDQVATLKKDGYGVQAPDWPAAVPAYKIRGREYLKACVCRPFLPDIFPGYETYLWMDADTWVQNWRGVELFLKGAERGKLGIAAQVDRAYPKQFRVKWLGPWPWKVRGFYFSNALKSFDFKTAQSLLSAPVLQAGVFAMQGTAPHWKRWQELVIQAMKQGKVFTAEQLCLGILHYLEHYEAEILPAWTHWLCEFKPLWDKDQKRFVEPYLPHETISILHLSGYDQMRIDRSVQTDFKTTKGETVTKSYRYPEFNGEKMRTL